MSARTLLIKGAYVLSMDPEVGDLETGDILVEGAKIKQVATSIDTPTDEVIDGRGKIAMPGMIDTHSHLWHTPLRGGAQGFWGFQEYLDFFVFPIRPRGRAEDIYAGTYVGASEFLANGVTTAVDFCHPVMTPSHADGAVKALRSAGLRTIWCYGASGSQGAADNYDEVFEDADRVRREHFSDSDPLLSMGFALTSHITAQASDENRREVEFSREHGLQMIVHSNSPNHVKSFHDMGLLGPDIIFAHTNLVNEEELELMAEHGATLTSSMQVETSLGYSCTALVRAVRAGVRVTSSIDSVVMTSPDLLSEARHTYNVTRMLDGQAERNEGRLQVHRRARMPNLGARDVLALITSEPARALGRWDSIGSLAPGKEADIVLLSTEPSGRAIGDAASHVVTQASVRDVDTVMVAGKLHKRNGQIVDFDPDGIYELHRAAQRHYTHGLTTRQIPSSAFPGGDAVIGGERGFQR